jgi:hypothetical protein
MSRTKQIPFHDSLAVWLETADEQEIRDGAVMLGIYARQRKFSFAVRLEPIAPKRPAEDVKLKEPA